MVTQLIIEFSVALVLILRPQCSHWLHLLNHLGVVLRRSTVAAYKDKDLLDIDIM